MLIVRRANSRILEEDEQINGEADGAQRRPGEVERDERQEQREIERLNRGHSGPQQHDAETGERRSCAQNNVEQDDRAGLARGALVAAAVKMRRTQIDEGDLGEPEIGDPQRIADRRGENEDREQVRIEHAREHEGLHKAHRDRACGGRPAQQQIGQRDQPARRRRWWRRGFRKLLDRGVHRLGSNRSAPTMPGQS